MASIYHWSEKVWSQDVVSYLGLISWEALRWIKSVIIAILAVILIVALGPEKLSIDEGLGFPELIEPD